VNTNCVLEQASTNCVPELASPHCVGETGPISNWNPTGLNQSPRWNWAYQAGPFQASLSRALLCSVMPEVISITRIRAYTGWS